MAILARSSFESGAVASDGFTAVGAPTYDTTNPRTGKFAIKTTAAGNAIGHTINVAQGTSIFMRFYFWISILPGAAQWICLVNPNGGLIQCNATGALELHDNNNSLVGSASTALSTGVWNRVELQCVLSGSGTAGTLDARVNGVSFSSLIGTATTGIGPMTQVQVGAPTGGAGSATQFIDDYALNDSTSTDHNTWVGAAFDGTPTPHGMGLVF